MRTVRDRLANKRRKRWRGTFLILFGAMLFFSVFLLRVWFSDRAVELACETDRLVEEKRALEEANRKVSLEIARLESPERISRIAEMHLGMIRSSDVEVIVLER